MSNTANMSNMTQPKCSIMICNVTEGILACRHCMYLICQQHAGLMGKCATCTPAVYPNIKAIIVCYISTEFTKISFLAVAMLNSIGLWA